MSELCVELSPATPVEEAAVEEGPVEDGTVVSAVAMTEADVVSAGLADALVEEAATVDGDQQERVEVVETQGSVPL